MLFDTDDLLEILDTCWHWGLHFLLLQTLSPWLFLLALFVQVFLSPPLLTCWVLNVLSIALFSAHIVSRRNYICSFHVHWYADDLQICISSLTSSYIQQSYVQWLTAYFTRMFYQHLEFPVFKAEIIMYLTPSSIPHIVEHTLKCQCQKYWYPTFPFTVTSRNQSQHLIYSVLLMSLESVILSEPNVTALSSSYFYFLPDLLQ